MVATLDCIPVSVGLTVYIQNAAITNGYAVPQQVILKPTNSSGGNVDFSGAISCEIHTRPLTGLGAGAVNVRAVPVVGSVGNVQVSIRESDAQQLGINCNNTNSLYAIWVQLNTLDWCCVAQGLLNFTILS